MPKQYKQRPHTWEKAGYRRRRRATIIRRNKRVFFDLRIIGQSFRYSSGIIFKLPDLLVEVLVKGVFDDAGTCASQLIFIQIDKYCRDIVQKLVDPAKVKERLINSL